MRHFRRLPPLLRALFLLALLFLYVQVPLFDPDVLAMQVYVVSGIPTKYVTNAYTDPAGTRKGNLITAGVFILLGLLSLAAAIWLPVKGKSGRHSSRPAKQAAAKPSYGEMVLGPSWQPPDVGER